MDGATTRLWIPAKKRPMRVMQLIVKNGWFHKDDKKETCKTETLQELQTKSIIKYITNPSPSLF